MKKIFTLALSFSLSLTLLKADSWTQKASLPADDRAAAAGFALNGKGYIGTGIKFGGPTQFHNDFWEYDPTTNSWLQKADFGGTSRSGGVGFSLLGKGYIACGYDANIVQQDMWEYDDVLNTWTQKASLPGPGRNYTVALTIDSFAYIGTGYDASIASYNDFWQYNPVANSWLQKADVGGAVRSSAIAFSANGKGYIGGGYSATYMDDFWEFNPALNAWTQKANIPGGGRSDASAFAIDDYGYILTGQLSIGTVKDLWKYNSNTNTWAQKTSLTGAARTNAVAFSIGNKGYIGTGWDAAFNSLNDFWEYTADSTTAVEEFQVSDFGFQVVPNPAKDFIVISYPPAPFFSGLNGNEKINLTITDTHGKKVYETKLLTFDFRLPISSFQNGIYFIEANDGKDKMVKKFLKE